MKLFLLTASIFWTALIHAQTDHSSTIDSLIQTQVNDTTPGLFIGVVHHGKIIYEGRGGLSNLQHNVKVSEHSRSNIASNAKQFTALMVLDLEMKGQLSLEDDIRTYLPTLYPNVVEAIKIRHLITHTSGIRDYCDLMSIQRNPWWRREGLDNDGVFELVEQQNDLAFIPGSLYKYSNTGYILLAKIIEAVTKEDFADYSKAFFVQLGMNNTAFMDNYMAVIPNLAYPYNDWGDGVWQQWPTLVDVHGDGALFTTLHDQLIYEKAVQSATKAQNELLLQSQRNVPNASVSHYGYGLEHGVKLGFNAIHHAGGTGSYSCQLYRFPEQELAVVVMSNNGNVWTDGVAQRVAKLYLPTKERVWNYPSELANQPHFTNADAVGYYASADGYIICIEETAGKLGWRNATYDPYPLTEEQAGIYSFDINKNLKAIFSKNRVVYSVGTGIEEDYQRLESSKLTATDLNQLAGKYFSKELNVGFELFLKDEQLMVTMKNRSAAVEVVNRDRLMVMGYFMTIKRDGLDRTSALLVSKERAINVRFDKSTALKTNSTIETAFGSISVSTVASHDGESSQILVTANKPDGNELWAKQYGGKGYDKANAIIAVEGGYLIVGSTSSYGVGNYDIIVMKIDEKGKKLWQQTYGKRMNDYGYALEVTASGYLIKGTTQQCEDPDNILETTCVTNLWLIEVDQKGNQLSAKVGGQLED